MPREPNLGSDSEVVMQISHDHEDCKGVDVLQFYPAGFAFFCLLIFVMPVVKCLDLAFDRDVRYWIGDLPLLAALLPPTFTAFAYLLNRTYAAVSKVGTVLALLGCPLALLVLGDQLGARASRLADRFGSQDCRNFKDSELLENARFNTAIFHKQCLMSMETTDQPTSGKLPVQDCLGYDALLEKDRQHLEYLEHLELRHSCSGWCEFSDPLWNFGPTWGDRCSVVVGELMRTKVHRSCSQVLTWGLVLLTFSSITLALALPSIRKAGLDW